MAAQALEELFLAEAVDRLEMEVVVAGEGGKADFEAEALGRGSSDEALDLGIGEGGEPFPELLVLTLGNFFGEGIGALFCHKPLVLRLLSDKKR